jgi:hypothetical protein
MVEAVKVWNEEIFSLHRSPPPRWFEASPKDYFTPFLSADLTNPHPGEKGAA